MLFFLILSLILALKSAPSIKLTGDDNPPAYPTFDVHVEIPPQNLMKTEKAEVKDSLQNLVDQTYRWRINAIGNFTECFTHVKTYRDTILKYRNLTTDRITPVFLQNLPGLITKVTETLSEGFTKMTVPEPNIGPFPVLNVFAEPPSVRGDNIEDFQKQDPLEDFLYKSNLTLLWMLGNETRNLAAMSQKFFEPVKSTPSFVDISPNYVEPNPAPYDEINFFMESEPAGDGHLIPDANPIWNPKAYGKALFKRKANQLKLFALAKEIDVLTAMFAPRKSRRPSK
jgi:hypothetical protein